MPKNIFEATLASSDMIKKIMLSIKELCGSVNLQCSPNGVLIHGMDTAHVSLFDVSLPPELFSHYRCEKNIFLGINLESMNKMLKMASNEDELTLSYDDGDSLDIAFDGKNKNENRYATFKLRLIEIESDQIGIPDTEYNCKIVMPSTEFKRVIGDISVLGDSVGISVIEKQICFSVAGDIGSGSITINQNENDGVTIDCIEHSSLSFASKYMLIFSKSGNVGDRVEILMSNNNPICIDFPLEHSGHMRYYLAPKIEEGDEDETKKEEEMEDDQ